MSEMELTWRAALPADLAGLGELDMACYHADGPELVTWGVYNKLLSDPGAALACAVAPGGEIAAVSWVGQSGGLPMLGGRVHPQHRRKGLGREAIRGAADHVLAAGGGNVVIRNESLTDGALALYASLGYATEFIEQWMSRPLGDPLPALPEDVTLAIWTDENALVFYETFIDSFKDRGGPARESAERWISGNADDDDFRPDLCFLAYVDGQPAAFVTAQAFDLPVSGRRTGWISQVGVRQPWRGRGIVDGLIGAVGRQLAAEGLATLDLDVNQNNPRAIRAYERNGFKPVGRRAKFSKTLGLAGG